MNTATKQDIADDLLCIVDYESPPVQPVMTREEALVLLGGSVSSAAHRIGVTKQAVSNWPKVLSPRLRDRVHAVLWREHADLQERARITAASAQRSRGLKNGPHNVFVPSRR